MTLFSLFLPLAALALLPPLPTMPLPSVKTGLGTSFAGTDDYRLGDEWGKKPVTESTLEKARPAFRRGALATARAGGATSFYLGKFSGEHVMATNFHVFSEEYDCLDKRISFPLLGVSGTCEKFLGSWSDIDLALFTIKVSSADESKLVGVGENFSFNEDLRPAQTLLTIGFGVAGNSGRQMVANEDSDCYVFSGPGEYRYMADPDRWNPGSYRAWSFSLGCDASHGDSGSPVLDRESGKVMGIFWTGKTPKEEAAQSTRSLSEIFRTRSELLWTELSYAVPARKIGEHLRGELSHLPEDKRLILESVLK